ncbi:MAG TPA: hypothetical protein VIJ58_05685 [Candidatus Dormibacteraeota bacterium]
MVTPPAVESALVPLSSALEADGYRMAVSAPDRDSLRVEVIAGPEACEDCLVPKTMMVEMLRAALTAAGLKDLLLDLVYPDGGPGTSH